MMSETLLELIMRQEGFRAYPYGDSRGILTVGYGHNLQEPMTKEEARALLEVRLRNTIRDLLRVLPDLHLYGEVRANALISMAFNMGVPKLKTFTKMLEAVRHGYWDVAALEAKQSAWFTQVGIRGPEIVSMLRTGQATDA